MAFTEEEMLQRQNFISVDKKTARSSEGEFFTIGENVGHAGAEDLAIIYGFVEEIDGNEIKVFTSKGHCHLDFLIKECNVNQIKLSL
jgi:hypothetical protein